MPCTCPCHRNVRGETYSEQAEAERFLSGLEVMLSTGRFDEVNKKLEHTLTDAIGSATILAILTMTYHAKRDLDANHFREPTPRQAFLEYAELTLIDRVGLQRTTQLLKGRR